MPFPTLSLGISCCCSKIPAIPWLLYKEKEKMVKDLVLYSPGALCSLSTTFLVIFSPFFCCSSSFLTENLSHILMYKTGHTCCFKVSCCMELHFLKQCLTGDCLAWCGSAQSEDKLSTASDRHRKIEKDQNFQNIAKDRYPQAILCFEATSFSSEGINASFPESFTVRSSLCSTPSLSI